MGTQAIDAGRYGTQFFTNMGASASASAAHVVPVVMSLLGPSKVIDVGCGTGSWLATFRAAGANEVLGVDGPWVQRESLAIDPSDFREFDLSAGYFSHDERFDLIVSLEVAEHLPETAADGFVGSLCGLGPAVLFSAAAPLQGGINHVNERWPEYWAELFARRGYVPVDCIPPLIWDVEEIEPFYRQNVLLYVEKRHLEGLPELAAERVPDGQPLTRIHPEIYVRKARKSELYLRTHDSVLRALAALPAIARRDFERRVAALRALFRAALARFGISH
jgi:SAM-dependent methyltransferase